MMIELFFISVIIVLGIATSYEDLKKGRIRNVFTGAGILFGIIMTIILNNASYLSSYFINLAVAFGLGFLIWRFNLWSAADAKLFTAFAALIPLGFYSIGKIEYFPSFAFFTNAFIPVFVFLTAKILVSTSTRQKLCAFRKAADKMSIATLVFSVLGIIWLAGITLSYLGIRGMIVSLAFTIILIILFEKAFGKKLIFAGIILTACWILSGYWNINILYIGGVLAIAFVSRAFIFNLSGSVFTKRIPKNKLKPGMLVSGFAESITKNDIRKMRKKYYEVHETIPFAPMLFAGAVLTIIFHGNVIALIILAA